MPVAFQKEHSCPQAEPESGTQVFLTLSKNKTSEEAETVDCLLSHILNVIASGGWDLDIFLSFLYKPFWISWCF